MTTVNPPWSYVLQLPHDPRAPRIARVTLRTVLGAHGLAELVPTAELVAAELLANAHVHTTGPYALRLRAAEDGRLRIGVWDTDPRVPPGFGEGAPLDVPPDEAENGRGLPLVRACASSWGVGALTGGKVLWAECG
ncbi:ATP-binding protein [Streptomyces sp. NPDC001812]|uniref:ATP-binding protein n=1 Tax=Streptomyces sp. NPDC001812 TaxID=3364611 RepID=UPI003677D9CD